MSSTTQRIRGVIAGYRLGAGRQYNNQVLIKVFTDPKSVHRLVGARVIVGDRFGNVYRGKVVRVHSSKNCVVVARFRPNIPGQLIGSLVDIVVRQR